MPFARDHPVAQNNQGAHMTIVGILVIIVLILLAIYLFRRIA
jgi:flagellar biogenesis protein FliO